MIRRTTPAAGSTLLLLVLAHLAFVSLGLPDGLLGVAWPSIRVSFDLPLDALGPLLVASTAGYVIASFASGRMLARLSVGTLLTLSCVATAGALLGYAAAPRWWMMVALGASAGLGAGAIDAGLNTYVASHHGARTVNLLHACYGIGAASGPIVMTSVMAAGLPWRAGYGLAGIAQLLLAACFAASLRFWPAPRGAREADAALPVASTLRLPAAWLGIAAFFVYTGAEATAGAWIYSLLTQGRGVSMHDAGTAATVFWTGLMLGRLVFGLAVGAAWATPWLRGCLVSAAGAAALLCAGLGYAADLTAAGAMGLAFGPIFPSFIAQTPARVGERHAANAVGIQVAAAAVGQSLTPALVGIAAHRLGLEVIGPALLGAAVVLLGLHELLRAGCGITNAALRWVPAAVPHRPRSLLGRPPRRARSR